MSGVEVLGKSAADKVVDKLSTPSIIKENKPTPNSGEKIADVMKKVDPSPVQSNEIELLIQQLTQFNQIFQLIIFFKEFFYLDTIYIYAILYKTYYYQIRSNGIQKR